MKVVKNGLLSGLESILKLLQARTLQVFSKMRKPKLFKNIKAIEFPISEKLLMRDDKYKYM